MFIKIGANKHRMRHKPAPECPAANAPACCGNMDNLKESPANGGEHCLAIAVWRIRLRYSETGLFSLRHFFAPIFLLLCKTAIVDFLWERRKINCDLSFKASLAEGGGPARDFAPGRKECCTARRMFSAPHSARGASRGRG